MLPISDWEKRTATEGTEAFKQAATLGTSGAEQMGRLFPPDQVEDREPLFSQETRRFLYSTLKMLNASRPDWTNATLLNGWVNYSFNNPSDPNYNFAQYRVGVNGDVEIRGLVAHGTPATVGTIFTLPLELRPRYRHGFAVCASGPGIARLQVELNGDVSIVNYGTGVSGAFVFLDNIRFSLN